jgi:hypothetical protein
MGMSKALLVRWILWALFLVALTGFLAWNILTWRGVQGGESPLIAASKANQTVTHIMLNPIFAIPFLFTLIALIWLMVLDVKERGLKSVNWLLFGTAVISLVTFVSRFIRLH